MSQMCTVESWHHDWCWVPIYTLIITWITLGSLWFPSIYLIAPQRRHVWFFFIHVFSLWNRLLSLICGFSYELYSVMIVFWSVPESMQWFTCMNLKCLFWIGLQYCFLDFWQRFLWSLWFISFFSLDCTHWKLSQVHVVNCSALISPSYLSNWDVDVVKTTLWSSGYVNVE